MCLGQLLLSATVLNLDLPNSTNGGSGIWTDLVSRGFWITWQCYRFSDLIRGTNLLLGTEIQDYKLLIVIPPTEDGLSKKYTVLNSLNVMC